MYLKTRIVITKREELVQRVEKTWEYKNWSGHYQLGTVGQQAHDISLTGTMEPNQTISANME